MVDAEERADFAVGVERGFDWVAVECTRPTRACGTATGGLIEGDG